MFYSILIYLIIAIVLLGAISLYKRKEGFEDTESPAQTAYNSLRDRLQKDLGTYCKLSNYVISQLSTIYKTADTGTTKSLNGFIKSIYEDMYRCKDELADSRQSCMPYAIFKMSNNSTLTYKSCNTYLGLPDWSPDDTSINTALLNITDDLPDRLEKETEWYQSLIKKLQDSIDSLANPPADVPESENSPSTDSSGKAWSSDSANPNATTEGFLGESCSPAAAQAKQAALMKQKLETEAASCTIPPVDSEIARINALLDSDRVKAALSKCNGLLAAMLKLQSDQEKAKNGTLFKWQEGPNKKSYKTFSGGDRSKSLVFSLRQNQ